MRSFEVLKITFKMRTPVLLGHPWIFFDSLIAHVLLRRQLRDDYYCLPSSYPLQDLVDKLDVPIRKIMFNNNDYIYDCSVSIIDGSFYPYRYMSVTHVRKRFTERHVHEVKTRKSKIEIAKGSYRMFDIKFIYVPCREITFYACCAESEIADLLRFIIRCLGKKRAEGFGFVKEVTYEKTNLRTAIIIDDVVTRPIPVELVDCSETLRQYGSCELVPQSYKPPYWSKANVKLCTVVGRRYVLKNIMF